MIDRDKIPKNFAGQETIIRFEDVSFEHGPNQPILDEVSFTVRKSTKITIMGQNGAGKTTLFGLILGDYTPESGEIHISNDASIATARQVIPRPDLELTVREFFAKCFKEKVYDIDPRIDEVLKIVSLNVPKVKSSPARAAPLRQGFEGQANDKGVPTFSKKNEGTLLSSRGDGGIDRHAFMDVKDRLVKTFSGGQQARFLLASALIQDPGILLLDEPTNNLDKAGIEHLTQFLVNYKKTCLVISHDAEFLNAFTHGVLYLDVHTRKVEQYVGDYKDVVDQITARMKKENITNARLAKEIQANKDQANMFAMKGGQMRLVAKRMREKAAELTEELVDVRKEDKTIKDFTIPAQENTIGNIIIINSYSIISPKTHKPVTKTCNIKLRRRQHLLLSGPNGIGKSTLLEAIVNSQAQSSDVNTMANINGLENIIPPAAAGDGSVSTFLKKNEETLSSPRGRVHIEIVPTGRVHLNILDGIRVGYYRQDFSMMDFNDTVYQSLEKIVLESRGRLIETELRAVAASFLIGADAIHTKIGSLSEGQKGLVAFARLVILKPGLLILDEPTNHINFRHIPVIARALDQYEGAMILVSHVPEFVAQIKIDEVLEMGR